MINDFLLINKKFGQEMFTTRHLLSLSVVVLLVGIGSNGLYLQYLLLNPKFSILFKGVTSLMARDFIFSQ